MSTILENGLPYDFPLELINEIISCNPDDIAFLRSASLVSKIWRAAALRYLFSEASFLCKNDFVRWGLICTSLPHVAQYVRKVVVDLGGTWRLQERATSAPTGFIARAIEAAPYYTYKDTLSPALDCKFPKPSDFDVVLPTMTNATSLDWTMPSTKDGFDLTAANTTRFLTSFPNITDLSYSSHLQVPPVFHAQFMSFFHNLHKCTFSMWGISNSDPLYVYAAHESRISISQLEEIWFEECELGSMDWLLDYVLNNSPSPIRIRKVSWDFEDPPFSSNGFARLLRMAHGTLEELCFGPPYTPNDLEGYEAPPFGLNVLPVLQILSLRTLHISTQSDRLMQWLNSIVAVFPSCPCLQRLEFTFYLAESRDIDNVFAFRFLDWNSLLENRYPSLKVLAFEMMMEDEDDFDIAERQRLETIIRQETEMVNSDKFVMRWSPAR
ncbi:hypothetical protein BDZ89DRAFT_1070237 [Hymenopellis radicata]|nr:hypothetical protein BDZ89DRAFT_1070237 [Hymenopellis radicata]